MEIIQHIIGLCPDTHSHFDLMNLIAGNIPVNDVISFFQVYSRMFLLKILSLLR